MKLIAAAVLTLLLPAYALAQPQVTFYPNSGEQKLPFSEAVQVGEMLYLAGQIGYRASTGKLVEGGISAETHQTLRNIKAVLGQHDSSLSRVVKCTVFLADIADFDAMNEVYRQYFPSSPPARTTVAVDALVMGARVEIECIAVVR